MSKTTNLLILLLCANVVFAQNIDKIIAVVGDEIILKSDVQIQGQQIAAQNKVKITEEFNCNILEEMLLQKLLLTQSAIDSIIVEDEEVELELENRIRYFVGLFEGDESRLEEYYDKSILEIKEEFRDNIRDQLLSQRMQQTVVSDVKVTPSDVQKFYTTIPQDSLPYYNTEIEMSQVVIKPKVSPEAKLAARNELLSLKERVDKGEDFETLAVIYSDDKGSAVNGGALGFLSRGDLVKEFASVAFRLDNGEISKIVETEYGFHLIQMIEKRGEVANIRHILIKPEISSYDTEKAVAKLRDVRNQILIDSISFEQAVSKYSDDDATKNQAGKIVNRATGTAVFEIDQVELNIFNVIDTMNVNEVSKPQAFQTFDGSIAYRIIKLNKKTEPPRANLSQDYERIKSVAESMEQQKALENWVAEIAPQTYISIDEDYANCNNVKKWMNEK